MLLLSAVVTVACADSDAVNRSGDDGALDPELLDREVNLGPCGYPSAGDTGYGLEIGHRLDDISGLIDCDGNPVQLADSFCPREDDYGDYNRVVLVSLGAGWCGPCIEETEHLMGDVYVPLHDDGVEIVQILFQDEQGLPPTKSFCMQWREETFDDPLAFPVVLDQTATWSDEVLSETGGALPMNFLLDANANIRWRALGENPADLVEQIEAVRSAPYGP